MGHFSCDLVFPLSMFEFYQVIEHVAEPAEFCKSLAALTTPEGATVISTINRSMRSYATAIVAAEYILRWVLFFDPFNFVMFHMSEPLLTY